jgi:carboxypeptidase family protein
MKPLSLSLILLVIGSVKAQTPKAQAIPTKDECTIAGMVVKLAGSEPLRKATLQLQNQDDRTRSISTSTDGGGRFELKGIAPGRYRLTARKLGFVGQSYGQRKPDDPGAILTLRPGQNMTDLLFRLIPSAVIAGRVINEEGEPLPWVQVSAVRQTYSQGRRNLNPEAKVPTNDLGEYRLFGLVPGRYFVRAEFKPEEHMVGRSEVEGPGEEEQTGYVPMYHPSSSDPTRANAITIKAGDEIPGVEILLRPVPTFTVRGRIYNMVSHRAGMGYSLNLAPRNVGDWFSLPERNVYVEAKDDSFAIPEVLSGAYTLSAFWSDENKKYQARQPIDVANADVEGATLTIAPGTPVSGRVVWEGQPSLDANYLMVFLRSADSKSVFLGGRTRATMPGWNFMVPDVYDGSYRVTTAGQSKDCFLKGVRYGSAGGLEEGFNVVRGTNSSLEITVSCRGARVQGSVVDADSLPAVGVWVALIPNEKHRNEFRLYKASTTDQYGHFDLRGIAPGDYQLFSWEEVESEAWEDPEFLKPFEQTGEKISLEEGELKNVNLAAIRTKTPEEK